MSQQTTGSTLRKKVSEHLGKLKQNRIAQNERWDQEKKELWARCRQSVDRLSVVIDKAMKMLAPMMSRTDVKDELFKFFLGNEYRIGKYLLLPIFSMEDSNTASSIRRSKQFLAFAWDIRKGEPCLRIVVDTSDNTGEGQAVRKNFFSQERISIAKKIFMESVKEEKASLEEMVDGWNNPSVKFLEMLNRSQVLESEDNFLQRIVDLYSEKLTKPEIKNLKFSRRSRKVLKCGVGDLERCSSYILGDNKHGEENLDELTEVLLDKGYPDIQPIVIDMEEQLSYDDEVYPEKLEEKTVGFTRHHASLWKKNERLFDDEYNNYSMYPISRD